MNISIIIPVYNVEKYLRKCLDSVCAQSDCVKEVILVNDGSTDGSKQICDEYAQNDSRIKVIDKPNGGAAAAAIDGVNAASCDYIGFVDGDDYIEPNMYELLSQAMTEHDADVVWCGYDRVNESGKSLVAPLADEGAVNVYDKQNGKFPIAVYQLPFSSTMSISGSRCAKLFKKKLIADNMSFRNFGIRIGEDLALVTPVMFTANRIVHINKYMYHYLQRETSVVHSYDRSCFDDWVKSMDVVKRASELYNYEMDFDDYAVRMLYSSCLAKVRISRLGFAARKKELKYIGNQPAVRALLKSTVATGDTRFKIVMKLLKLRMYGLLAIVINKGVSK